LVKALFIFGAELFRYRFLKTNSEVVMRLRKPRLLMIPLVVMMATVLTAGLGAQIASAATSPTPAQVQLLRTTLAARGATAATIDAVIADPALAASIPVSSDTVVTVSKPTAGSTRTSGVVPLSTGGTCTGYSRTLTVTNNIRSLTTVVLGTFTIRTFWCYNYSVVTFATSTRSGSVTLAGTIGGLSYDGEQSFNEYIYSSYGSYAFSQGKFTQSPFHIGTLGAVYPTNETWVHRDGTYGYRTTCNGC